MEAIHNIQHNRSKSKFVGRHSIFYYVCLWENIHIFRNTSSSVSKLQAYVSKSWSVFPQVALTDDVMH